MQELKANGNAVFRLWLHLVLVTKYRRKVLNGAILSRCGELVRETCERWEVTVAEFNGEHDHVHILLDVPPKLRPCDLVNALKTRTSRVLRSEFSELREAYYGKSVLWSPSYCMVSAGGAPLDIIKRYIEDQNTPL